MTPERLAEIEREWERCKCATMIGADGILAEVRRLWAERDARLLVGRPVEDELLARVKRWRHDTSRGNEAAWPMTLSTVALIDHIAFLERLLADADDLPQVRRTGYADGWRAALAQAKAVMARKDALSPLRHDIEELIERGPE